MKMFVERKEFFFNFYCFEYRITPNTHFIISLRIFVNSQIYDSYNYSRLIFFF